MVVVSVNSGLLSPTPHRIVNTSRGLLFTLYKHAAPTFNWITALLQRHLDTCRTCDAEVERDGGGALLLRGGDGGDDWRALLVLLV